MYPKASTGLGDGYHSFYHQDAANLAVQATGEPSLGDDMSNYAHGYRSGDALPNYAGHSMQGPHHTVSFSSAVSSGTEIQSELPSLHSDHSQYQNSQQYLHENVSQAPVQQHIHHPAAFPPGSSYQSAGPLPYNSPYEAVNPYPPGPDYRNIPLELVIRQQPAEGVVVMSKKEKCRKPIDPPPIVELRLGPKHDDPFSQFLQNPYFFMTGSLVEVDSVTPVKTSDEPGALPTIMGSMCSSLHRLKDTNGKGTGNPSKYPPPTRRQRDMLAHYIIIQQFNHVISMIAVCHAGFFVFSDMSVRDVGNFKPKRLLFSLYEMQGMREGIGSTRAVFITQILSEPFNIVSSKDWKGLRESTILSRTISDQGVRLRLRKEPRSQKLLKRAHDDEEEDSFSQTAQPSHDYIKGESDLGSNRFDHQQDSKRQKLSYDGYGATASSFSSMDHLNTRSAPPVDVYKNEFSHFDTGVPQNALHFNNTSSRAGYNYSSKPNINASTSASVLTGAHLLASDMLSSSSKNTGMPVSGQEYVHNTHMVPLDTMTHSQSQRHGRLDEHNDNYGFEIGHNLGLSSHTQPPYIPADSTQF